MGINYTNNIIVGDFNYKNIDWSNTCTLDSSLSAEMFLDTINDLYIEQLVNEPTRFRVGQSSSLLDLVLTNNIYLIEDIGISDPIGKSDHAVIIINTNIYCFVKRRLYFKGQYDKMRSFFSGIDWKTKLSLLDTQASWDVVLEHICN